MRHLTKSIPTHLESGFVHPFSVSLELPITCAYRYQELSLPVSQHRFFCGCMIRLFSRSLRLAHCAPCLIAGLLAVCPGATSAAQAADQSQTRVATALQYLQRFKALKSADELQYAVSEMDGTIGVATLTPSNFVARRRFLVRAWANILKGIEQSYDPTYDPNNPNNEFSWTCTPSRPGAIQPPNSCNDTQAQQINRQKANRAGYYVKVQRLDLRAMSGLEASLAVLRNIAPRGTPTDFAALDGILREAGISAQRRTKIDAYVVGRV